MRRCIAELRKTIYLLLVIAFVLGSGAVFGKSAGSEAKNVILMISDGCGYNHVDAATIYQYGKTGVQSYEQFPVKLAMATYLDGKSYQPEKAWSSFKYVSKSKSYTDSAAAATTMSTGVKTKKGYVGLDPDKAPLKHTVELAEERGRPPAL